MTRKTGRKTTRTGRAIARSKERRRRRIPYARGWGKAAITRDAGPGGIERLFAGKAVIALLKLFLLHPARDFYQREIATLTGKGLSLIQGALAKLVGAGIISQTSRGNRIYYRANASHPALENLKGVVLKTFGVGDALRAHVANLGDRVSVAFIYGSVARGEETAASDIDVMLIGDATGREIASALAAVRKVLAREINPAVYGPKELRKKFWQGNAFIREVLAGPKIFLLGGEGELRAIVGRRPA